VNEAADTQAENVRQATLRYLALLPSLNPPDRRLAVALHLRLHGHDAGAEKLEDALVAAIESRTGMVVRLEYA
jgi:hypothetical protein